ncbi:hypothetical protein EGW08_001675 [Elysia chlorotica]|uniref:GAT domain-containing protein n=1 Tax=Elysia chlorotica TaxID=188477 RepID=A0A3S1BSZ6_ELYCH|nr:hypothetical protein EGW08_001675 [Elysia chlorotica]
MQSRLVELLNEIATEEITNDLLRVNDDLNNVFLRYERFERLSCPVCRQATTPVAEPAPIPTHDTLPPAYDQLPGAANPRVGNLIDLSDEPPAAAAPPPPTNLTAQMVAMNLGGRTAPPAASSGPAQPPPAQNPDSDDFDMFAQSRQSFDQSRQALGSTQYDTQQSDTYSGGLRQAVTQKTTLEEKKMSDEETLKLQEKETDYDEMEQWLATHGGETSGRTQEPITSSEFDRFLLERGAAASSTASVPSIPAQAGGQQQARTARTLQKDEEENPLFAL